MATKQFNLRLRDGLDRLVRVRAAELGVDPRDVVEDALIAAYGFQRDASAIDAGQLPLIASAPPAPASPPNGAPEVVSEAPTGGCPECGGDWRSVDGGATWACGDCGVPRG